MISVKLRCNVYIEKSFPGFEIHAPFGIFKNKIPFFSQITLNYGKNVFNDYKPDLNDCVYVALILPSFTVSDLDTGNMTVNTTE